MFNELAGSYKIVWMELESETRVVRWNTVSRIKSAHLFNSMSNIENLPKFKELVLIKQEAPYDKLTITDEDGDFWRLKFTDDQGRSNWVQVIPAIKWIVNLIEKENYKAVSVKRN